MFPAYIEKVMQERIQKRLEAKMAKKRLEQQSEELYDRMMHPHLYGGSIETSTKYRFDIRSNAAQFLTTSSFTKRNLSSFVSCRVSIAFLTSRDDGSSEEKLVWLNQAFLSSDQQYKNLLHESPFSSG